jgi:uncharacterized membrane protein YhaH (DUF805 family)
MEYMFMPLRRYADFSGRSRRMEFWMWQVFKFAVVMVFYVILFALAGSAMLSGDPSAVMAVGGIVLVLSLVLMLFGLAIIIPDIAVAVRRLHDTERSGWWILAPLAPYVLVIIGGTMVASTQDPTGPGAILIMIGMVAVCGLALTLLVFYFLEGTKGPNKYGPDPKQPTPDRVFA